MTALKTPFTSETFETIWMNHFQPSGQVRSFAFLSGVRFYQKGILPVYENTGKNLTKGNYYSLGEGDDYRNKVFIIYDVPTAASVQGLPSPEKGLRIHKSVQYPGFLVNLDRYATLDEYLLATFSKNSRMKLRKFCQRLDASFEISSRMYFGHIDKEHYEFIFKHFMDLLVKRYSDKEISYNNMQPKEWRFYRELAYPLILEKRASLFVVYDRERPIAITYNYHFDQTIIDAITVFDIDYSKFNLGYVNNLKLLNWCFSNGVKKLDFSKGFFEYKKRLCDTEYDFEYHILYDSKALLARAIAFLLYQYYELKRYLRKKNFNVLFHKFTFIFQKKAHQQVNSVGDNTYKLVDSQEVPDPDSLELLPDLENGNPLIKLAVFEFLYLTQEAISDTEIYEIKGQKGRYLIKGRQRSQILEVN